MVTEPLGKLLPQILLPYLQQWTERSGLTLLSRLLVDEQFLGLLEKYGGELMTFMAQGISPLRNGTGPLNGNKSEFDGGRGASVADANANDFTNLHDRVLAMEAQYEAQQALFVLLRSKIRPLALALGCCPECLVGMAECLKCNGSSRVGHYTPDYAMLESHIVAPLAGRGVPLVLNGKKVSGRVTSQENQPPPQKGVHHGRRNVNRERPLGK